MTARLHGVLAVRAEGAAAIVRMDEAGVVIDVVRPRRLAGVAGLRGRRGLRALTTLASWLRQAPVPVQVSAGGRTLLTAGRGRRRVTAWGLALAALTALPWPAVRPPVRETDGE